MLLQPKTLMMTMMMMIVMIHDDNDDEKSYSIMMMKMMSLSMMMMIKVVEVKMMQINHRFGQDPLKIVYNRSLNEVYRLSINVSHTVMSVF